MVAHRSFVAILALSAALSTWGGDDTTLRIVSVDPPPPYSLGDVPPETIVVEFNLPLMESSINWWTLHGSVRFPTLTSPTQLTVDVDPVDTGSPYSLTLGADIDGLNDYSALRLGLLLGNQLTAPPELVAEIHDDLAAIRRDWIEMTGIHVRLPWVAASIKLNLNADGQEMYESGTFYELYALNEIYGPVLMNYTTTLDLRFERDYHSPILAAIYHIDGVIEAYPRVSSLGDGPYIEADPPFYTFVYRFGDCEEGCISEHVWEFEVIDGETVVLLNEYGDPLHDSYPLVPWVVASEDGRVLDGEFSGSFPSGNGVEGGSFEIEWGWCDIYLEGRDPTSLHYVDSFRVATGWLSDLRSSGNFGGASCLVPFAEGAVPDPLPDPPPGEGRYYLARGLEDCSAYGYGLPGQSGPLDPRLVLNGICGGTPKLLRLMCFLRMGQQPIRSPRYWHFPRCSSPSTESRRAELIDSGSDRL